MPKRGTIDENAILEAALIGLQHQHTEYTAKIAEIRRNLGIRAPRTAGGEMSVTPVRAKRRISAVARKRIGEATRRRWAEYRAKKAVAAKKAQKPAVKKAAPTARKKAVKKVVAKKVASKKSDQKKTIPATQQQTAAS